MMRALDSLKRHFYKARPLGAALFTLWATVAGAEVVSGAQLPDGSQKVGENRYLVSHYEDVEFVLRREDLFTGCSEERLNPFDWPGPEPVPEHSLTSTGMVKNVIELDPPHLRGRGAAELHARTALVRRQGRAIDFAKGLSRSSGGIRGRPCLLCCG